MDSKIRTVQVQEKSGECHTILQVQELNPTKALSGIARKKMHPNVLLEVLVKNPAAANLLTSRILKKLEEKHQVFCYNMGRQRYEEVNPKNTKPVYIYCRDLRVNVCGGIWVDLMTELYNWQGVINKYPAQVFPLCLS